MMKHLEISTDVVNSNRKLILAVGINVFILFLFIFFNGVIADNKALMIGSSAIAIISASILFFQIIKKF